MRAVPALALLAPLACAAHGEELRFEPAEGLVLRKAIHEVTESLLVSSWTGGEPDPVPGRPDREVRDVVLVDRYARVDGGRVLELVRSFETARVEAADARDEIALTSPLEGERVRFTWNEREAAYAVVALDPDVDERLLEDLEADADLRQLLPHRPVEPGDTWTVAAQAVRGLFRLGGGVPMEPPTDLSADAERWLAALEATAPPLEETLTGELRCRYVGRREADGVQVAVVSLAGDYARTLATGGQHSELAGTLAGELLWNVAGGHPHALSLVSEDTSHSRGAWEVQREDCVDETTFERRRTGTGRLTIAFTPVREWTPPAGERP